MVVARRSELSSSVRSLSLALFIIHYMVGLFYLFATIFFKNRSI